MLGLRDHHTLLDIGCGSLRAGRLFIPYLKRGCYCGIEPNRLLVENGMKHELGMKILDVKEPIFHCSGEFDLTWFSKNWLVGQHGKKFDFLLAQSIFSHAAKRQIKKCMREAFLVMHKDSLFVATYFRSPVDGHDYTGDTWQADSTVMYRSATMMAMANKQGLLCKFISIPHPCGQSWIILHKPGCSSVPLPSGFAGLCSKYNRQVSSSLHQR